MMYQTFQVMIEYLEESGKIIIDDGDVVWTHNPKLMQKILREGVKFQ